MMLVGEEHTWILYKSNLIETLLKRVCPGI